MNTGTSPMSPLDLSPLYNALASLNKALARWEASGQQDEELRDACIQRFEYTFELGWKMLARRLERDLPANLHTLVEQRGLVLQGALSASQAASSP
jgi:Nucleotidyltransferase substrate binding protein like